MNILITGGTSGLGKATVELLAKCPEHHIHFTYLNTEQFHTAAEELCNTYANVSAHIVNFCEPKSVDAFCEKIAEMDLDVLINSAYVGKPQSDYFHKIPVEDMLRSFESNIIPTVKLTQAALKMFRKKKYGKVINIITSYVMNLPPAGMAIYVANKAYLEKLSDVISKEYVRFNITSNCILPEFMNTGFGNVDERLVEMNTEQHPLKQLLTPNEVAEAIAFFVNTSQQVNGVKLPINAAQTIM